MKVLVACEVSGVVRDAFARRGHDAWSCDIQPTRSFGGQHIQGDARDALTAEEWDLVIAHPPCTYLAQIATSCVMGTCRGHTHSGDADYVAWRREMMRSAADLFRTFLAADVPRVAIENPQPHLLASQLIGAPTQYVDPYLFGDPWMKRTGWWLRGVQPLYPTKVVSPEFYFVNGGKSKHARRLKFWPERERDSERRSETAPGMAAAMADQWGHPEQTLWDT